MYYLLVSTQGIFLRVMVVSSTKFSAERYVFIRLHCEINILEFVDLHIVGLEFYKRKRLACISPFNLKFLPAVHGRDK